MATVYVVLHAESTHHIDGLVGGWFDSELTSHGHEQARRVAKALRSRVTGTARLYSSDLRRALQTAEPIGTILSTRVEPVFDLREMSCGVAEGKPRSWLDDHLTPPPRHGNRLDHQICEGAETRRSAATRVSRFVKALLQEPDGTSIVVTHGVVFTYLLTTWLGISPENVDRARFSASPASITTLQIDPAWDDRTLAVLNETAHLHAQHALS